MWGVPDVEGDHLEVLWHLEILDGRQPGRRYISFRLEPKAIETRSANNQQRRQLLGMSEHGAMGYYRYTDIVFE
jgi:hypothetical protein